MRKGMLYAASAFFCWGLFPLYFKQLQQIPALEMLAHRMLWSLLFVLLVLGALKRWSWMREVLGNRKTMLTFFSSAALLAFNWFLYVWAVNNGHVIESSLGYFINPLMNVMFGFLLLKERLRPMQWGAIGLAACGVLWLTMQAGHLPWIALGLAGSFATYGLLRKTAPLGALEGLSIETMLMLPLALGYLAWLSAHAQNSFMQVSASTQIWMALAGPITAIPLLLFAAGARRIPLSMLGLFQYIGPSLQLMLGIFLFHEAFNLPRFAGFAIIWSALALYTAEGFWHRRHSAAAAG